MSKSSLVRGAFALQCRLSVPPVTVAVSRCSHCSTHYRTPTVKYGTVQKSNLAKWRQDDVCCRRAIRRWNAETVTFPEMCGTPAAEQKIFIHSQFQTNVQYYMLTGGMRCEDPRKFALSSLQHQSNQSGSDGVGGDSKVKMHRLARKQVDQPCPA